MVFCLSVTNDSTLILSVFDKNKLDEYSPEGQLIREISLLAVAFSGHPWHAIKLNSGHFVVCHRDHSNDLHRVFIVDADGNLKKCFGGKRGSSVGQMSLAAYLAVNESGFMMVADPDNRRVLLLDPDLEFKREIIFVKKHGFRRPEKILLYEPNGQLLVIDNESNNQRVLIFDFK